MNLQATYPREHASHHMMRQRCYNPNNAAYQHYGGRGIRVCDQWGKFANFLQDMGERPLNTSLDRIDNNGHYTPNNCRWATQKEQIHNSSTCKLTDEDVIQIKYLSRHSRLKHSELAELFHVKRSTVSNILSGRRRSNLSGSARKIGTPK